MAEYKISKRVDERVLNYRFSVDSKKDPEYIKLKKSVNKHNQEQEVREEAGLEPHYLRVRGRGRGPIHDCDSSWSITDDNSTYFDVYVQRDTDRMARYRKRTAGQKIKGYIANNVNQLNAMTNPVKQSA